MHRLLSGPLSVERLTAKIAGLPATLQGKKLVQMSDFHYDGLRLSEEMLEKAIAFSNEAKPDLILLTGDYITTSPEPIHTLVQRLKHLQSNAGIYAILGNHDIRYRHAKTEVTAALTSIGVRVLWNEIAYPFGKELPLVGLADRYSREFNPQPVMSQLDPTTPRIVLSHNPDTAEILQAWRVDLQLSGHTHGGQIVIPGLGPILLYQKNILPKIPLKIRRCLPFLRKNYDVLHHWEWSQGLHRVGKNQLYVNRGLGTYLPGRLFCPPEVTVITLENDC
ncbi:metallophosphoesterase [Nostoc sp. NIES-4103]|nr:metallophosphoesterase [Nostoc sp. NIES-4103]